MSSPIPIDVSGLTHDYGDRRALKAIDLRVSEGEIVGLLGPNGGGKTTLFRILSTHLMPQAGDVRLFGLDPREETVSIRSRIGVVFQRPSLDPKLSVAENLIHHGMFFGLKREGLRRRAAEVGDRLGLVDRMRDRVDYRDRHYRTTRIPPHHSRRTEANSRP